MFCRESANVVKRYTRYTRIGARRNPSQAVGSRAALQETIGISSDRELLLLSIFTPSPVKKYHCTLASTKLCCYVTDARVVCEQLTPSSTP